MRNVIVKMLLVVMAVFIFGAFQYGYINTTPPPFKDSWQAWFAGIALLISVVILVEEVVKQLRDKEISY